MSYLYNASISPISKAAEMELAKEAADGNKKARDTLIRANIRYALSYAKTFYGQGLSNEEVDSEAVIGLIKAIDHFDYSRGTRIITLAKMYIMNEIVAARNKSGYVQRQSDDRLRMILKINKALKKINTDIKQSELVEELAKKTALSPKVISELMQESLPCVSLDSPLNTEDNSSILSSLQDSTTNTEEEALFEYQKEELLKSLKTLNPIEKEIICMSFGINKLNKPYSLIEIGNKLNLSKQYVFYVKTRALNKLKHNMDAMAA